jgi:hypothetical protein
MLLKNSVFKLLPVVAAGAIGISPGFSFAAGQATDAIGPIERLNCYSKTMQVLGVTFHVRVPSVLAAVCGSSNANPFKYVAVTASETEQGLLVASKIVPVNADYVPGATAVYIKGTVTSQKLRIGEFAVTGSRIVGLPSSVPFVGALVEVVGTQPLLGGPIVAAGMAINPAATSAGSDVNSVLNGIVGSGITANGIVGSGVATNGIVGSGVAVNGIVGSGIATNGIVGSGVVANGIVGSGVATNGIVGSGVAVNGIVGSGIATNGIVGSGVVANGIVGSGVATSGIVGSGVAVNGIVGSGIATNGIVGSGVATNGIVGSGVATSGIVGSGVAVNGIVGSGIATNGIVGSGVVTNGIVGSGVATNGIVGSGYTLF